MVTIIAPENSGLFFASEQTRGTGSLLACQGKILTRLMENEARMERCNRWSVRGNSLVKVIRPDSLGRRHSRDRAA